MNLYVDVPCATRYISVVSGTTIVAQITHYATALIFECCVSHSYLLLIYLPLSLDVRRSNYEEAQDLTSYDEMMKKNKMRTRSKSKNSSIQ